MENGGVELVRVVQCPAVFINFWQNWTAKWTGGPLFVVHVYNKMWSVFDRFWYILKHFRSSFTKFNPVLLNQVYLNLRIYPGFSSNDRISVTKISNRVSTLLSRGCQKSYFMTRKNKIWGEGRVPRGGFVDWAISGPVPDHF